MILAIALVSCSLVKENTDNLLDVEIKRNCDVNFLPTNTSPVEAFTINIDEWQFKFENCKEKWKKYTQENAVVDQIVAGNVSQAAAALDKTRKEERSAKQQLKLVVLFAYQLSYLTKLGNFCFVLIEANMKNQCFTDVYKLISSRDHTEEVEVLGYWFYFLEYEQNNLQINFSESFTNIFYILHHEIFKNNKVKFLQFTELEKKIRNFFWARLISEFSDKGLLSLLEKMQDLKVDSRACFAYHEIFSKYKNEGKLDSIEALFLRVYISKRLQKIGNSTAENVDEIRMCTNVTEELMKHSEAHLQVYLAQFDAGEIDALRLDSKYPSFFIREMIHFRYSKENLPSLMLVLWGNYYRIKFGCDNSLYLVEKMRQHPDHVAMLPNFSWQELCPRLKKKCRGTLQWRSSAAEGQCTKYASAANSTEVL